MSLCDDSETSEHLDSQAHCESPAPAFVYEERKGKFAGEDNRFPFTHVNAPGKLFQHHEVGHGTTFDPRMGSYVVKSWPSPAMNDDLMIYGIRDEHSVEERFEDVQQADPTEGD